MKSTLKEDIIIYNALEILEERLKKNSYNITKVEDAENFLILKLSECPNEYFTVMFLDTKHRLIEFVEVFKGTIDACSVHPREIVSLSLQYNAAAVIFGHNHPSGIAEPSQSDIDITDKIRQSLSLIDVRVLDHIVVGGSDTVSFAKRGLV